MLALMLAFFGTVIAVNFAMATLATSTFGGTVVENSYVASQRFNTWLREARVQQALGWVSRVSLERDRRVRVNLLHEGRPIAGATLDAVAQHPVGREPDVALRFRPAEDGTYRSTRPLPEGRWLIHLEIRREQDRQRLIRAVS